VAVAPGTAFGPGGEGHVRVSIANGVDSIREGVDRISESVATLAFSAR
jgi:aspartate aminotransferase